MEWRRNIQGPLTRRFEWLRLPVIVGMAAVLGGCAGAGVKVEGKIGVIDPPRILNETNAGKKAKDSLSAFSKNRQALMELDERELRRMEEDFVKQASVLSPT